MRHQHGQHGRSPVLSGTRADNPEPAPGMRSRRPRRIARQRSSRWPLLQDHHSINRECAPGQRSRLKRHRLAPPAPAFL